MSRVVTGGRAALETLLALCFVCLAETMPGAAQTPDCGSSRQGDMNACARTKFEKAEAGLEARVDKIVACLKGGAEPLLAAQRAWREFRKAECAFQAGKREDGGSAWPMVMSICLQSVTEGRSKELDYYLTCKEGDLSCPTFGCRFSP